jgi:hypothetical protein
MTDINKTDYTIWSLTNVLPDELLFYSNFDIQKFLNSKKSFLTNYKIDNELYSDFLDKNCKENNLNPKIILINLQKEQSILVKKSEPPEKVMNRALGFGMTDFEDISKFYGFKQQHISAITWFKKNIEKYKPIYSSGKKLDILIDNNTRKIIPINLFTYLLYLYTPWSGSIDSLFYSKYGIHGVYLFWKLWKQYWVEDLKNFYHL